MPTIWTKCQLYGSLIGPYHFQGDELVEIGMGLKLGEMCWQFSPYHQVDIVVSGHLNSTA